MSVSTCMPAGTPDSSPLPLSRIAAAPLPELLASVHGKVVDGPDLPGVGGGMIERAGRVVFAMRPQQPAEERDLLVRQLLAHREGYSQDEVQAAFAAL